MYLSFAAQCMAASSDVEALLAGLIQKGTHKLDWHFVEHAALQDVHFDYSMLSPSAVRFATVGSREPCQWLLCN